MTILMHLHINKSVQMNTFMSILHVYNPPFHIKMPMIFVELSYVCLKKSFTFTKYSTCTYKTETYFASVVYPFTPDVILLSASLYRGAIGLHVHWYSWSYRAFSDKITEGGELKNIAVQSINN